jgi:hypothetical protein
VVGFEDLFLKGGSTYSEFGLTLGTIIIFIKSSMKFVEFINWVRNLGINIEITHLLGINFFIWVPCKITLTRKLDLCYNCTTFLCSFGFLWSFHSLSMFVELLASWINLLLNANLVTKLNTLVNVWDYPPSLLANQWGHNELITTIRNHVEGIWACMRLFLFFQPLINFVFLLFPSCVLICHAYMLLDLKFL